VSVIRPCEKRAEEAVGGKVIIQTEHQHCIDCRGADLWARSKDVPDGRRVRILSVSKNVHEVGE
jgi:hypothetical protein